MSEAECKYICSRGLLKSCDYYSRSIQSSTKYMINYPPLDEIKDKKIHQYMYVIQLCLNLLINF